MSSDAAACPHCGFVPPKKSRWPLYIGVTLITLSSIAGYGIYTGHRSSDEVAEAAKAKIEELGHPNPNIFINKYVKHGNTTYTCGSGHYQDSKGDQQAILFVALQTGPLLDWLGIHIEGEKSFNATYVENCM